MVKEVERHIERACMRWERENERCLVDLGLRASYFNSLPLCLEERALVCPTDMPFVRVEGKGFCSSGEAAGCSPSPKALRDFKWIWAKSLSALPMDCSAFTTHSITVIKATGKQHTRGTSKGQRLLTTCAEQSKGL